MKEKGLFAMCGCGVRDEDDSDEEGNQFDDKII